MRLALQIFEEGTHADVVCIDGFQAVDHHDGAHEARHDGRAKLVTRRRRPEQPVVQECGLQTSASTKILIVAAEMQTKKGGLF